MNYPTYFLLLLFGVLFLTACDQTPTDANTDQQIDDENPVPDPGTDLFPAVRIPRATTGDVVEYVLTQEISQVSELMDVLPLGLTESFTLMEQSESRHLASLEQPRIIMYGTDARFIMGVSSHTDDPLREIIEMVEVDSVTGFWKFSQLDFTTSPPTHDTDDTVCQGCHGTPVRPIWGRYPDWPGAFGADEDNLTSEQVAVTMELKRTQSTSDRFKTLLFPSDHSIQNNATMYLASRSYGYANTAFNFELATSVAEGLFKRIKASDRYEQFSYMLLSSSWCDNRDLPSFDIIMTELGLDGPNDFLLHKFAGEPSEPGYQSYQWNQGSTSLHDIFLFLILDDLVKTNNALADVVQPIEQKRKAWIDAWWNIRGEERRTFLLEEFDLYEHDLRPQEIIIPIKDNLCACVNGEAD